MSLLFYLTFILLIIIVIYYFLYQENLNHDNLFYIILNFIFLIILPLYYFYFEDLIYSFFLGIMLFISSFILNLKIKEIFHQLKVFPLIYFLLTSLIHLKNVENNQEADKQIPFSF